MNVEAPIVPRSGTSDQPKPTILSLPNEIQIQILSYLCRPRSIYNQIKLSKTCSHWRTLLLNTQELARTRYPIQPGKLVCSGHHSLFYSREVLRVRVKDDKITGLYLSPMILRGFDLDILTSAEQYLSEHGIEPHRRAKFRDVTNCPFLVEKPFTPFPYRSYGLEPSTVLERLQHERMQNRERGQARWGIEFKLTAAQPDPNQKDKKSVFSYPKGMILSVEPPSVKDLIEIIVQRGRDMLELIRKGEYTGHAIFRSHIDAGSELPENIFLIELSEAILIAPDSALHGPYERDYVGR